MMDIGTDWIVIAFLITLLAGIVTYLYLTWNFQYWKKRNVPYVKPTSVLFGNLWDVLSGKKHLAQLYEELYWQDEKNELVGFFRFRTPSVLLRDPKLIKSVLVKDFSSFQINDFAVSIHADPLFGRNPFVNSGEAWKVTRSQITAGFTNTKMKAMYDQILYSCKEMEEYVDKQDSSDGLDVKDLTGRLAADSVASCSLGINGNSFKETNPEFLRIGIEFLSPSFWKGVSQLLFIIAPYIASFLRLAFATPKVTEFFRRVVKEAEAYRKNSNVKRNDYFDLLLQLKEKHVDKNINKNGPWYSKFTDEDVAAQALTFFTDGFETSSAAITFTLYELGKNPEIQNRLREEIVEAVQRNNGELSYDVIQNIPYLDMVLSEGLRMHPPIMFTSKVCSHPIELTTTSGKTVKFDVGTPVIVPILALHYDPKYFHDPEVFNPERFNEENVQTRPKHVYIPFNEGPRICIGMKFGQALGKCALATLLLKYDIIATSKTPKEIQLNLDTFFRSPLDKIYLKFKKRAN